MASKMYILIRAPEVGVDLGHAILAAAHASLGGYLTFVEAEKNVDGEGTTEDWVRNSFRKVVVKATDAEFEKAKTYGEAGRDFRVMTESGLGGMEVAMVFRPRDDFEPFFRSLRLYGDRSGVGMWVCGQLRGEWKEDGSAWDFQGVFSDKSKADAACRNESYFMFPAILDNEIPDERMVPPEARYPRAEEGKQSR